MPHSSFIPSSAWKSFRDASASTPRSRGRTSGSHRRVIMSPGFFTASSTAWGMAVSRVPGSSTVRVRRRV